jgi:hypothetical protein
MDSGTPVSVHVFIKASAMFFADNERKVYANGKDVAESHNTIKLLYAFVFSFGNSGPAQSM